MRRAAPLLAGDAQSAAPSPTSWIAVLTTVLFGIGGALVGGIVASAIGTGGIFELNFAAAAGLDRGWQGYGMRNFVLPILLSLRRIPTP